MYSLSSDSVPLLAAGVHSNSNPDSDLTNTSTTKTKKRLLYDYYLSRTSADESLDISRVAQQEEFQSCVIGLPKGVGLGMVAGNEVYFPSTEKWKEQLKTERGEPGATDVVDELDRSGLVLIWHSIDAAMSDDAVRNRLAKSKLWINVKQVILVNGYISEHGDIDIDKGSRARSRVSSWGSHLSSGPEKACRRCDRVKLPRGWVSAMWARTRLEPKRELH